MKVRTTKRYCDITGEEPREFETQICGCGQCETGQYYCTTEPATYLCRPNRPPYSTASPFHHVHASNVEPCDPLPAPGQEQKDQAGPCVAEPETKTVQPAHSETSKEEST